MDLFFADDARQRTPTRPGMGSLIGVGGLHVPAEKVAEAERALDDACASYGFPAGQEFKWSPGRELWMHQGLVGQDRTAFYYGVMEILRLSGIRAIVVAEDVTRNTATRVMDHEQDVVRLFLERVQTQLRSMSRYRAVIVDRPGGGRSAEDHYLAKCAECLRLGTRYVQFDRIAIGVVSAPSERIRLLQAADLVVGCSLAYVSGEDRYSPALFGLIRPLLCSDMGRVGGVELKLHPDLCYANLYSWLLGDTYLVKVNCGHPLPLGNRPYATSPHRP